MRWEREEWCIVRGRGEVRVWVDVEGAVCCLLRGLFFVLEL